MNRSHRPTIASSDGPNAEPVVDPAAAPGDGDGIVAPPTAKANDPVARCPSTAETVRQATV